MGRAVRPVERHTLRVSAAWVFRGTQALVIPNHQRCSSQRSKDKTMINPMPMFQIRERRCLMRCSQGGS